MRVCQGGEVEPPLARVIWHRLESINAVAYFCQECLDEPARLGLEGFWAGYFACRAAPLGAVEAGVVEATFFNFHPRPVRRAIPNAWTVVAPSDLTSARASAAAAALRRLLSADVAEELSGRVLAVVQEVIDRAVGSGRPLFSANRDVAAPSDPVAAMWQAATTLREHRGDAHVALLATESLDGCEAHVLFSACEGVPAEMYQRSRGWSVDDWQDAVDRLVVRDLLRSDGHPTDRGRQLRERIERRTDEISVQPYAGIGDDRIQRLLHDLTPAAERIAATGEIMFPNPMGLPRDTRPRQD